MRHYIIASLLLVFLGVVGAAPPTVAGDGVVELPEHKVQAMYFHRTNRCPTCKRIGGYAEDAIKAAFVQGLKDKSVSFHLVDFQDAKNSEIVESYNITGPTLVLANVEHNKVTAWKAMPEVWSLVGKKDEFFKYVQNGVRDYLEGK